MKTQKGFIQIPLLVAIIAGILVLGAASYVTVKQYKNYQAKQIEKEKQVQELLAKQQKTIDEAQNEIDILKKKPPQIVKIESTKIISTNTQAQGADLPALIAEWRPRMAYIECTFKYSNGEIYQVSGGSGIVTFLSDDSKVIITNKHVMRALIAGSNTEYTPDSCFATLPNNNKKYNFTPYDIRLGKSDLDWGALTFTSPDNTILDLTRKSFTRCAVSIGDQIVVLGYPSYGTGNKDITVTEGIISGYDFPYYTTSAKLEHGNSGGAAISVKNNCYIGIPTGAIIGGIESLGRILDFSKIESM